jgi:hypothetical protein
MTYSISKSLNELIKMSSNNFQSNKSMNSKFTPVCKVCKDAGKADFNHFVKNLDGSTNCPTLLSQDCRYCKAPGHTAKYCPQLAKHNKEDDAILRRANNSTTTRPQQTAQINCFASKNVFAGLESDESDEETQSSKKMKTNMGSQLRARGSQPPNGNKNSTTIKTNNFSISSSTGLSTKASKNFVNPLCQPTATDFPSLPKSDKPNYAAIAAKAEVLEKAVRIQQEKDANEEIERTKASTMLHLVGQAGSRTDSVKDQSAKEVIKETKLQKPTEEGMEDYQICGDYIYDYINTRYRPVAHLAGKITGMIMELEHNEVKQMIKNSKELDNRIVEGIDSLKPKLVVVVPQVKVVQAVAVAVAVPTKSILEKRKIDWTADDSDVEEDSVDNSAW